MPYNDEGGRNATLFFLSIRDYTFFPYLLIIISVFECPGWNQTLQPALTN